MTSTKLEFRSQFLAARKTLSLHDVEQKSLSISEQLIARLNWSDITSMHCFLPIADANEPDMRIIVTYALDRGIDVFTSLPKGRILPLQDTDLHKKIKSYSLDDGTELDLIIVPMLAYDPETKHRLGYGGGFYDRLLLRQPQAQKIGVCFDELSATLPVEPHDQPLDAIITDRLA